MTSISMLLLLLAATSAGAQNPVGLLVEPLSGPGALGRKTSTLLHLQIWQTLRAAPPGNAQNVSFGKGIVYWDERASPPANHSEAEALGGPGVHFVLWGSAAPYGSGVVVQAYLTVANARAPDNPGSRIWKVPLPELGTGEGISVDIPAWRYEFAPIVLRREVIPELNTPEGIAIYEDRTFSRRAGTLGSDFRALQQGPDLAMVESGGVRGWVKLPGLAANRSELTDFCGAVIRLYRSDWGGAVDLFRRVVSNPRAPVSIRVSSYLMMAAAEYHARAGAPSEACLQYVEAAEKLNPYLQETVRYKCMALLAARKSAPSAVNRIAVRKLDATVQGSAYLFPSNDRWLGKVRSVVEAAGR